jgi:hypothetical protein
LHFIAFGQDLKIVGNQLRLHSNWDMICGGRLDTTGYPWLNRRYGFFASAKKKSGPKALATLGIPDLSRVTYNFAMHHRAAWTFIDRIRSIEFYKTISVCVENRKAATL